MQRQAKTKILATLGPASDTVEIISELIDKGADAFRLNFSYGSLEHFEKLFNAIETAGDQKGVKIPIMQDLQGPKMRIGKLAAEEIEIAAGDKLEISIEEFEGTKDKISTSYTQLVKDSKVGDTILLDDGMIRLEIIEKKEASVICNILSGGTLKANKGMNMPGMKLSTPSLTEEDLEHLDFALKFRVDYIVLSFVRHPDDLLGLRQWLESKGLKIPIIAKIEKPEAVDNFESILKASDGIMIARGDLGIEIAPQLVPVVQKNIIRRCNAIGKMVITSTQMLESMIHSRVPTRAEASDVANAVMDGADVVMLSGETAIGKYPAKAVQMMDNILVTSEAQSQFIREINYDLPSDPLDNVFDSTGKAFMTIANQLNAKAIAVFTRNGKRAEVVSKFRPNAPIYAFTDNNETAAKLNLMRGVYPFKLLEVRDTEIAANGALLKLKKEKLVDKGDLVIFISGEPKSKYSRDTWMRYLYVN